jgi:hypothetical protein
MEAFAARAFEMERERTETFFAERKARANTAVCGQAAAAQPRNTRGLYADALTACESV